jgi:hypothetical protein
MTSGSTASTSSGSSLTSAASTGESIGAIFVNPYATINVKTHITITLELKHPNFTKWKAFFISMCSKFGLFPHIDGNAPPRPDNSAWGQADVVFGAGSLASFQMPSSMSPWNPNKQPAIYGSPSMISFM